MHLVHIKWRRQNIKGKKITLCIPVTSTLQTLNNKEEKKIPIS